MSNKQVWEIIQDYQCAELQMVQNPALAVWNHQQAIVNQLKAEIEKLEALSIESSRVLHNVISMERNKVEILSAEKEKLESRIKDVLNLIEQNYDGCGDEHDYNLMKIDKALRGES